MSWICQSDQWAILYQANLSASDYFDTDSYNSESVTAGAALIYKQDAYNVSIQPNARYVRQGGRLQDATPGVTGRVSKTLTPALQVYGSLGYFDRRVPLASFRSGDGHRASMGMNYALSARTQVGGEYMFQREKAQARTEARRLDGPSVYAAFTPTPLLELVASYRYASTQHDAPSAVRRRA